VIVIEDKPPPEERNGDKNGGAFGTLGRLWVLSSAGWREWPQSALGADERELLSRVADSIRLQVLHTIDYRKALANQSSPDERRKGRDLSRMLARDVPIARDLASNLLETAERLSVGHDATPGTPGGTATTDVPPPTVVLPTKGAPTP
jgi:hypothetical protein